MREKYIAEKYQELADVLSQAPNPMSETDSIVMLGKMMKILDDIYEKGKEEGIDFLQGLSINN